MSYHFHDFELDERLYQLRRGGKPVEIEPKVFDVLVYLMRHRDHVVSKDELLEKLWPEQVVSETALTRCIVAARKAVGDDGTKQEVIETQHGRGYRFVAPVSERSVERKLAAVLSADVKGYSRLMGEDEVGTVRTLTTYRQIMTTIIQQHHGRVVDSPGDNLLAEFASVVDAVQAAVAIQQELKGKNADLSASKKMEFRIGINLGDVIVEGERIYGDGVNIAARVESLAEASGICISGPVYDQVKSKLALQYESLGEQPVKNIAEPVRVYRIKLEPESPSSAIAVAESTRPVVTQPQETNFPLPQPKAWLRRMLILSSVLLLVGIIVAVQYLSLRPPAPSANIPPEQSQSLPLPDKPSIVVLPFVNMSEDPKQEYFSDGITEDLTGDLSRISSLFVIARNSAFTYKGKATKVQEVSKELGVRYVLEGSVRRADDQVRVTTQLIDATTGYHLWSERYDRPFTDIFSVQDEIVQQLVTTLRVEVHEAELARVRRIPTTNLSAYDALLRAEEPFHRVTPEGVAQARPLYEQALALDPQYAEAYAWLGWTYWEESHWDSDPQKVEQALALAQKAIALDNSLAVAHSLLSLASARTNNTERAIAEGQRAVMLNPNNAYCAAWLGEVLNYGGRPADAIEWLEKAMRLDPHYPYWFAIQLGLAYQLTGRYAEALATYKHALLLDSTGFSNSQLALIYVHQWGGQLSQDPQIREQALAAVRRAVVVNDSFWEFHRVLGYVYLYQQQYKQAVAELERAVALYPNGAEGYANLACVLSYMGRTDEALRAAEQAQRRKSWCADVHLLPTGVAYTLARRYEEALASLKQFLKRYPDILEAHLTLAVVYSELGKEVEARAEVAEVLRINPKFSLEVHKERVPIKDPATLEWHIAALRKAGLK